MIAKFRVQKVETIATNCQNVTMMAVTEKPFDGDGKSDDNSFARWTPSGELKMCIQNPDLIGKIVEGQKFYLNFELAEEAPAAAAPLTEQAAEQVKSGVT